MGCIIIWFLIRLAISDTIICGEANECELTEQRCLSDEPCNIFCNATNSCYFSDLHCKDGYECNVHCDSADSCRSSQIQCPSDGECSIYCDGTRGCYSSVINCPSSKDCSVYCRAGSSCYSSDIHCPYNNTCRVECDAWDACLRATIDAKYSSTLGIFKCGGSLSFHDTCEYMNIWAPPNTNNRSNCYLEGNNNLNHLTIYAINGWNDVNFRGYTGSGGSGTLYCMSDYSKSCAISGYMSGCANQSSICMTVNNQELPGPTNYPTTNYPTEPTTYPSTIPTNDSGSSITIETSNNPTTVYSATSQYSTTSLSSTTSHSLSSIEYDHSHSISIFEGVIIGCGIFLVIIGCGILCFCKRIYNRNESIDNNNNGSNIQHAKEIQLPRRAIQQQNDLNLAVELNNHAKPHISDYKLKKRKIIKTWIYKHAQLNEYTEIYYNLLIQNGYDDISLIAELTSEKLIAIGINKMAHRVKIIKAIENTLSPLI